jgi:hypothetical protein
MKKSQEALLDYCEAQPGIQKVMSENRLTRDDLEQLYGELVEVGAGQWRGRHFVAASSIAYPHTLEHLVATWGDFDKKDSDKKRETSFKLLMHFERGIPLDVNVWDHL